MGEPVKQGVDARRRRLLAVVALVVLVALAIGAGVWAREHLVAKRFAEVEPGLVYRAAYTEPWALRRVIREHGIRRILCLMDVGPGEPRYDAEAGVANELGVALTVVPMPGDGCADFASLDRAADLVADAVARKQPIFVHCAAGVQRTNAAIVAYRLRHCGWDYDRAMAEAYAHWLDAKENPELVEHLQRYAERVAGEESRVVK